MPREKPPRQIERLTQVARLVLRSRCLDELEEAELAPKGEVPYQFSARGHELAQVLLSLALIHPHDAATVYYRSRPFVLTAGLTLEEALAGGMGRATSPSMGRDVGVVFSMPRRSGPTILPASGDVGAQYTPAAGWAQAIRYRYEVLGQSDWNGAIAVALGGDGSVATNGFWAAITLATTQRLPLLVVIEDNGYGLSVPGAFHTPGGNIAANLQSFSGLKVLSGLGNHPEHTTQLIDEAVSYVRSGEGPCLLRLSVPRLCGHTFIDNQAYKSEEYRREESKQDPLLELSAALGEEVMVTLRHEASQDVRTALEKARGQPLPDPTTATRHLFFEGEWQQVGGNAGIPTQKVGSSARRATPDAGTAHRLNLLDAVRHVLAEALEQDPRVVVFGEDVGYKGGVHGATLGLQTKFGSSRVFDTSLSEEGIVGRAVGMALAGLRPIPEIQFRKYADPATEQINDCGTLRWRTANRFAAPMIIRMPIGYGKKTGDPWHSVSGEAVYAHTPGWRIVIPSNAADAAGLLRTALREEDPVLFLEHRALLDTRQARRPDPGPFYTLPFGQAATLTEGRRLTLVTWGAMVYPCQQAAEHFTGEVSVMDLRTLCPWDRDGVLASVRHTGRLLVVHEDGLTAGFGAEIVAEVASKAFYSLDAPIRRMAVPDVPIPYQADLMKAILPNEKTISAAIQELLAE